MPSGHDSLRLWDLKSLRELRPPLVPEDASSRRGQVTCVAWLPEWTDAWKTLCFGTALGYVVFWQETVGVSSTMASLTCLDSLNRSRIASGRCPRDALGRAVRFYRSPWIPKAISHHGSPVGRITNTCKYSLSMISGTYRAYLASNFPVRSPSPSPSAGTLGVMSTLLVYSMARCR